MVGVAGYEDGEGIHEAEGTAFFTVQLKLGARIKKQLREADTRGQSTAHSCDDRRGSVLAQNRHA